MYVIPSCGYVFLCMCVCSVGQIKALLLTVCQEEQADDETYEQFEERVVNKRAGQMFLTIKRRLRSTNILFSEMVKNNNRKQVGCCVKCGGVARHCDSNSGA